MPEQGFNFQELTRQLGLKNVDEMPVVRALTPTIVVADASSITAPLDPPNALAGDNVVDVVAERAALQLRSLGVGGAVVTSLSFSSGIVAGGIVRVTARLALDGVDPLAVDPLSNTPEPLEFGPTPTVSQLRTGSTTVIPAGVVPHWNAGLSLAEMVGGSAGWFLPRGSLLTIFSIDANRAVSFAIQWRDLPVAALTPTG